MLIINPPTLYNKHVFPSNTVGPRSLSKGEANEVLVRILSGIALHA